MARVMHIFTVVRNNWKKTVVGIAALSYGANYARNKFRDFEMMHDYCEEALTHGEETIPVSMRGRNVTVILNPVANRRKAKKEFEKYCAPLLHLSGVTVTVIQTEMEGHARDLLESLSPDTDAIVVAGGDGTLSEVVTGLLRRSDANSFAKRVPVGVLPLGHTNSVANKLFSCYVSQPRKLAEATMAVVKGASQPMDIIQIQPLEINDNATVSRKPIYSMSGLLWGPFRDANSHRDKYWYFGPLRGYASYLFTAFKGENGPITWTCKGQMEFTAPCEGCSNCLQYRYDLQPDTPQVNPGRWWNAFMRRGPSGPKSADYSKVMNEECSRRHSVEINSSEVSINTTNVNTDENRVPHLAVFTGPAKIGLLGFIKEGWSREHGKNPNLQKKFHAKEILLMPKDANLREGESKETPLDKKKQKWISIDSEDYEIKTLRMILHPKRVQVFTPRMMPRTRKTEN